MIKIKLNGVELRGTAKDALATTPAVIKTNAGEGLSARIISQPRKEHGFPDAVRQLTHKYDLTRILECHEDSIEVPKKYGNSASLHFHLSLSATPEADVFRKKLIELLSRKWKPGFFALVADKKRKTAHSIFRSSPFPETRAFKEHRILALADMFASSEGDPAAIERCEGVAFGISDEDWHLHLDDLFECATGSTSEDCGGGLIPKGSKEILVIGEVQMSDGSLGPSIRARIGPHSFGICPDLKNMKIACFMYFSLLKPALESFTAEVTVPIDMLDKMDKVSWKLAWAAG